MNIEEAILILETLLSGINPDTGEVISSKNIYSSTKVRQAINFVIIQLDSKRGKIKYPNSGKVWEKEEDLSLSKEFYEDIPLHEISKIHGRTLGAINSRLLKLGLIEKDDNLFFKENFKITDGKPNRSLSDYLEESDKENKPKRSLSDYLKESDVTTDE